MSNKKIFAFASATLCFISVVAGLSYMKKNGVFERYPDAVYLDDDDAAVRPIYQQLGKDEKAVYTALYEGISEGRKEIKFPCVIDGDTYTKLYCILEKQEGGLFQADYYFYVAKKMRSVDVSYLTDDESELQAKRSLFDEKVKYIVDSAPSGEYEKALYIHDAVVNGCEYDADTKFSGTAYGCLVEGKARCEGYAKAFCHLARELDMECVVVTGKTTDGEDHAWNQIKIDGEWYNCDVTWDDPKDANLCEYNYFLCSDAEFLYDESNSDNENKHIPDDTFEPFECGGGQNYYEREGLCASSISEAEEVIRRELANGNRNIKIKFDSEQLADEFELTYINDGHIFDIAYEVIGGSADMKISFGRDEATHSVAILIE